MNGMAHKAQLMGASNAGPKKILLIHQDKIQHYRVPVYNYLYGYLVKEGFLTTIVSEGLQEGNDLNPAFPLVQMPLRLTYLIRLIKRERPDAVILFVNLKNGYLFPLMLYLKFAGIKQAIWTHGIDLQRKNAKISLWLHRFEHFLSDAIILYADHLRKNIAGALQRKVFVANNTLDLSMHDSRKTERSAVLKKYGITTVKNVISVGRIQRRKRIDDLIKAFERIDLPEVGLILVGPDEEGLAAALATKKKNVFVLGAVYGNEAIDLLRAADVYCIPGAIGLSIVDAQYCGLPVVTEDVDHGPEIMYLKDGTNGFIVPKGDINALTEKLRLLLIDDALRARFSEAAKKEVRTNGHIDRLCEGFKSALDYLLK
jgi:glycosyltransferase involved in cell wall biosynthesis